MKYLLTAALTFLLTNANSVYAYYGQPDNTAGATGAQCRYTKRTEANSGWTRPTRSNSVMLPRTSTGGLAGVYGEWDGLPPTRLDSFVREAGGLANKIYGDEDEEGGLPKIEGFNPENRIEFGITNSENHINLTTGHESYLPSACGAPTEMYVSGDHLIRDSSGSPMYGTSDFRVDRPSGSPSSPPAEADSVRPSVFDGEEEDKPSGTPSGAPTGSDDPTSD